MPAGIKSKEHTESHTRNLQLKNGLNTRHRQLMRELLAGATNAQAAARAHFSIGRVIQLQNSELFVNEMNRMNETTDDKLIDNLSDPSEITVQSILKEGELDAARNLSSLASGKCKSEAVGAKSAKDLLEMRGHKAPTEVLATVSMEVDEGLKHMIGEMAQESKDGEADK